MKIIIHIQIYSIAESNKMAKIETVKNNRKQKKKTKLHNFNF